MRELGTSEVKFISGGTGAGGCALTFCLVIGQLTPVLFGGGGGGSSPGNQSQIADQFDGDEDDEGNLLGLDPEDFS